MPVKGAQLHAVPDLRHVKIAPHSGESPAPGHQAAQQMQPVQSRDQIKKSDCRVRYIKINHRTQLPPGQYLPDQKNNGESAAGKKGDPHAVHVSAAYRKQRPLQGDTAQYQRKRIRPQEPQLRRGTPVLIRHPARICDDQKHEQDGDHREEYLQSELPRGSSVVKVLDRTLGRHPRLDRQIMENTHVAGVRIAYVLLLLRPATSRGGTFCGMKSSTAPGTL